MKRLIKITLVFWPLAIIGALVLSFYGPAVLKGPAIIRNSQAANSAGRSLGFPMSKCYYGPAGGDLSPDCSDLKPPVVNILTNLALATVIYIIIVVRARTRSPITPS